MPVVAAVEATRILTAQGANLGTGPDVAMGGPAPRVIILTTFDLDQYVYDALCAGASGIVLKGTLPANLLRAIEVVAVGEALLDWSVTRRGRPRSKASRRAASPTRRSRALVVNQTTVKSHVAHLLMKLDLRDRVRAVVLAYESGFSTTGAS